MNAFTNQKDFIIIYAQIKVFSSKLKRKFTYIDKYNGLFKKPTFTLAIKKRTSVETFLNHSTSLLAQFNHKFNLDKLPVFGFEFQCLVLAQN